MSDQIETRLIQHAAAQSVAAMEATDESDAMPVPSQLETDLKAAALYISGLKETVAAVSDSNARNERLLYQAVEELNKYREWANQVRYVAGAGPLG